MVRMRKNRIVWMRQDPSMTKAHPSMTKAHPSMTKAHTSMTKAHTSPTSKISMSNVDSVRMAHAIPPAVYPAGTRSHAPEVSRAESSKDWRICQTFVVVVENRRGINVCRWQSQARMHESVHQRRSVSVVVGHYCRVYMSWWDECPSVMMQRWHQRRCVVRVVLHHGGVDVPGG